MRRFIQHADLVDRFHGKRVAIVGSAPTVLANEIGQIDSYDIVVRVNNYKTFGANSATGKRTDVHYSFYGRSVRKISAELEHDGVKLCMCKCPDGAIPIAELPDAGAWHKKNRKELGIDFRWIYNERASWWFCDTYAPTMDRFLAVYNLLGKHIPTTGFMGIAELLSLPVKELFVTGFDFFVSGKHNVDEQWTEKNTDDPIGHWPEVELLWLKARAQDDERVTLDAYLRGHLA